MNKYYAILKKILDVGKVQDNKKERNNYLLNEQLLLTPADLFDIFECHNIARKKLKMSYSYSCWVNAVWRNTRKLGYIGGTIAVLSL